MATTGTVKGVLLDSTGRPVPDAIVMVAGGTGSFNDMAAVTNDSGEFYLSNLTLPGRYSLHIQSSRGMIQKEVQVQQQAQTIQLTY